MTKKISTKLLRRISSEIITLSNKVVQDRLVHDKISVLTVVNRYGESDLERSPIIRADFYYRFMDDVTTPACKSQILLYYPDEHHTDKFYRKLDQTLLDYLEYIGERL